VVLDELVLEIGDAILAHVLHAHPHHDPEDQRAHDEATPVLRLARVVVVEMERVRVHREKGEPGVVELADRAARPVPEYVTLAEVLEKLLSHHSSSKF
jgi:site-specific recombinase